MEGEDKEKEPVDLHALKVQGNQTDLVHGPEGESLEVDVQDCLRMEENHLLAWANQLEEDARKLVEKIGRGLQNRRKGRT